VNCQKPKSPIFPESVLVNVTPLENTIGIRTYSREIGRCGRFLIIRDHLEEWIRSDRQSEFIEMDCGHVLTIQAKGETLQFTIYWLSKMGNRISGYEQRFEIPEINIYAALYLTDGATHHLHIPNRSRTKIESHASHEDMRKILDVPIRKRAFSKAMRDCFNWRDKVVHLYADGDADFSFRTNSEFPIRGGLILHSSFIRTKSGLQPQLKYSIHT